MGEGARGNPDGGGSLDDAPQGRFSIFTLPKRIPQAIANGHSARAACSAPQLAGRRRGAKVEQLLQQQIYYVNLKLLKRRMKDLQKVKMENKRLQERYITTL